MSKQVADILDCQAKECSYNHGGKCRTIAINVGGPDPLCDTYVTTGMKGGVSSSRAIVGACKVDDCMHNELLECMCKGIRVVFQDNHALCGSYRMRAQA